MHAKNRDKENAKLPEGLHKDYDPKYKIISERPVHRTMAVLAAQGYTNVEIAAHVGRNPVTVGNALRQPFAREYIIKEAKRTMQEDMKKFLEGQVMPSLEALVAVRDGEGVKPSDRTNAANALLDRFLGKPVQPINNDSKPVSERSDAELTDAIERKLAEQS